MPLYLLQDGSNAHKELVCQNVFYSQKPSLDTARRESKYIAEVWRGSNAGWFGEFQTVITVLDLSQLYPNN